MSGIVFAGTPKIAAHVLMGLITSDVSVAGVLTRPDAAVGRRKVLTPPLWLRSPGTPGCLC